jgi:Nif-specific regulatory protein/two-component system response regulator AtoC
MASRKPAVLNPVSFLQTFVTQSLRLAAQKGCAACDNHFNHIESIGLTASSCFEAEARQQLDLNGPITPGDYADVILHIKNRIGGGFSRSSSQPGVIRVENTRCPFGDMVKEAPELCRMTSSVFGGIAARNFGYAKVELKKTIAAGDGRCEVCIYTEAESAKSAVGDEYRNQEGELISSLGSNGVSVRVAEKMERAWCSSHASSAGRQPKAKPTIVAESREMREALEAVEIVAPTEATVLITGETGVGKEIIAQAIHALSERSKNEFVAVNCGAIPADLIESALFGHEKGSFTGACNVHHGFFERAEHGTLFLDEIDSLPLLAQAKLLRVLQEGEYERVGGRQMMQTHMRVIAASNRKVEDMVAAGQFRSDLYYRLNVVPIEIPPLCDRREDLLGLVNLILRRLGDKYQQQRKVLGELAWAKVMRYAWPGNVRELENVLERAYLFARGPCIEDLDARIPAVTDGEADVGQNTDLRTQTRRAVKVAETQLLRDALLRSGGNVSAVAREVGITSRAVHQKLKAYSIDPGPYRMKGRDLKDRH